MGANIQVYLLHDVDGTIRGALPVLGPGSRRLDQDVPQPRVTLHVRSEDRFRHRTPTGITLAHKQYPFHHHASFTIWRTPPAPSPPGLPPAPPRCAPQPAPA